MARKMGNFVYRSKNSSNHEVILPHSINSTVIDLRGVSTRSRRADRAQSLISPRRFANDIVRSKINRRTRGTLPDEYYAEEFIKSTPSYASQKLSYTKAFEVHDKHEELSREALMAELASLDDADLKIQNRLRKDRPTVSVASQPRVVSDNFFREQNAGGQARKSLVRFDLIPDFDLTLEDELSFSSTRKTVRKFIFFALFITLLGSSIGLSARFGAPYFSESLHFKEAMLTKAQGGYISMLKGREALLNFDAPEAEKYFLAAQREFSDVEGALGFFSRGLFYLSAQLPAQTTVSSASHLLEAGNLFAQSGLEVSRALASFDNIRTIVSTAGVATERGWTFASPVYTSEALVTAFDHLESATYFIQQAQEELVYVRPQDIPSQFQEDVFRIQEQTHEAERLLGGARSSISLLLLFLGHERPKTYLIMFQNSTELRATGGFVGTYGLLSLDRGNLEELFIEGIYYPDGQLSVDVIPPRPLQYVTPNWGTRDANWFFDFPTSAQKVMWFYEKTGGVSPDGVIALNSSVIESILALTGPIELPDYELTVSHENFLEIIQLEVEDNYDKELNRPKQILSDLAPEILARIMSDVDLKVLSSVLIEALTGKNIMIYSTDADVQEFLKEKNWTGEIINSTPSEGIIQDYLGVVVSNLKGAKTDLYTDTQIDTVTRIEGDGSIIRTVILLRDHRGGATPYAWYNRENSAYIRVYVPKGSIFISSEGFSKEPSYIETDYEGLAYISDPLVAIIEDSLYKDKDSNTDIFIESGKTVFGNWMRVAPGEQELARITYRLPWVVSDSTEGYQLTIQKQSGLSAQYSGSLQEFGDSLSLDQCAIGGIEIQANQFKFIHTQDVTIRCELTH